MRRPSWQEINFHKIPGAAGGDMEGASSTHKKHQQASHVLECRICLAPPVNPVATSCGHLFCWPCLYRWLQGRTKPCPVCRAMVRKDLNITPIYGGNSTDDGATDSDGMVIPPRPKPPAHSIPIRVQDDGADEIISMNATSDQIISASLQTVRTLMDDSDHNERARSNLRAALETERRRVREMRVEQRHLMASLSHLSSRNHSLIHEAGERARRQAEERRAFQNRVLNSVRERLAQLE